MSSNGTLRVRKSKLSSGEYGNLATVYCTTDLHWQKEKERRIEKALTSDPIDLSTLRQLSQSLGGLLNQHLRKKVWPKLVGVNVFYIAPYEGPPLSTHKERPQILLDVNRCGKRIPSGDSHTTHMHVTCPSHVYHMHVACPSHWPDLCKLHTELLY